MSIVDHDRHIVVYLIIWFSGITLRFKGQGDVKWSETTQTGIGDNSQTQTDYFSAKEVYLNQDSLLFGNCKCIIVYHLVRLKITALLLNDILASAILDIEDHIFIIHYLPSLCCFSEHYICILQWMVCKFMLVVSSALL